VSDEVGAATCVDVCIAVGFSAAYSARILGLWWASSWVTGRSLAMWGAVVSGSTAATLRHLAGMLGYDLSLVARYR
jgi:hypothetical protein